MRPDLRRGHQADRAALLQAALPQRARLRGRQRRQHGDGGALLPAAARPRHRQVRRHRQRHEVNIRELPQPEETVGEVLRHGDRQGHPVHRVLLQGPAAAQYTGLPGHFGRV